MAHARTHAPTVAVHCGLAGPQPGLQLEVHGLHAPPRSRAVTLAQARSSGCPGLGHHFAPGVCGRELEARQLEGG
eukprot:3382953-Rhodomonas_salina.2